MSAVVFLHQQDADGTPEEALHRAPLPRVATALPPPPTVVGTGAQTAASRVNLLATQPAAPSQPPPPSRTPR